MDPEAPAVTEGPSPSPEWQPRMPRIREHLPSVVWGAALPIAVYFLVRHRVHTDAQALVVAGGFSGAWVVLQFARRRQVDLVGAAVLLGFALGVACSVLLGGNTYVLKIRDAALTAVFGVVCLVTLFTHDRPAFFYVTRYLSAGSDPTKVSAFDLLHEVPTGPRTFRVLSVVWGIGLVVEAGVRMLFAGLLPTGTFLAVSPFITASIIGSLFAFTVVYSKRAELEAAAFIPDQVPDAAEPVLQSDGCPQIPFP
jgi:hypothetical protein